MTYEFSPRIYNPNDAPTLYNLPKPIHQLTLPQSWKYETHKVPLADGGTTYGLSRNPFEITIQGEFGSVGATKKITEEEMWGVFTGVNNVINIGPTDSKLEFFLYYDSSSTTYVKYKSVYPIDFTVNMGDDDYVIFPYSLVLGVDDATVYTTAEGV